MENDNRQWVADKMSFLNPPDAWNPDSTAALARFHQRRPGESWWYLATAAAVFIAAVVWFPAGRAVAQQLWQFLTVHRVAVIRVNSWPRGIAAPEIKMLGSMIPPIPASDVDQVRRRVNYEPRLPHPGVLSDSPRLSTTFSLAGGTIVKTAVLETALQKAGITGVTVPPEWDNAQLALHTSGVVVAEWPDIMLAQSLPLTLTAPPGFDFPVFSAIILRVLGVAPDEAQRLATQMGTAPPWLLPLDRDFDKFATIEEVQLASGPATLILEKDRTTIFWSVPDRVYLLSGKLSRELTIATANAVQ